MNHAPAAKNAAFRSAVRKFFGKWNLFEILLLSISLAATATIFFLGREKNPWSLLSSVFGIVCVIHVACIVSWIRHRRDPESAEVRINSLRAREYLLLGMADCIVTVAFYFLLKALGTDELIVSTISLVSSVSAAYLMLRRSEYYAVCFIVNDIILLILWGLRVYHYGVSSLPTLITFVVFLINDVYGFLAWRKRRRRQNAEEKTSLSGEGQNRP